MPPITAQEVDRIAAGYDADPTRSSSLRSSAYLESTWFEAEHAAVFARSWQWLCHVEKLSTPGSYVTATVASRPVVVIRDRDGLLRAFYNVCRHRAHELLSGCGTTRRIICPYHAWSYDLNGQLKGARGTAGTADFDVSTIRLQQVGVEEFAGMVYVNLDPDATPLAVQAADLGAEIASWAPDVATLTHAKRLTYRVRSNWKNVIDNFLECYHCHVAHPEFVDLVDMNTYQVVTHGIWSSHFAAAGEHDNAAYDVSQATVRQHAVWWLWPNTCLLRYPGRGNFMVFQVLPDGPDHTLETWDFFLETTELTAAEQQSVRYIDEVLQAQDIAIVESVQRGMATPAFHQGRFVCDPAGSGLSEHGVHHFHGLLIDAYRSLVGTPVDRTPAGD